MLALFILNTTACHPITNTNPMNSVYTMSIVHNVNMHVEVAKHVLGIYSAVHAEIEYMLHGIMHQRVLWVSYIA